MGGERGLRFPERPHGTDDRLEASVPESLGEVREPDAIGWPSGSLAGTANVQTAFCGQITIGGIVDTGELFGPAPARTIVWTL